MSTANESELEPPPATTTSQLAEIERRSQAASEMQACDEKASFDRVDDAPGGDPPFRSPDQRFVLYSISHARMPPIARDPTSPGLRFYAIMESRAECRAFAAEVAAADPSCSLLITDTHRWDIAVSGPDRLTDPHYKPAKIRRIAEAHALIRNKNTSEFRDNVASHRTGGKEGINEDSAVSEETREVRRVLHQSTWDAKVRDGHPAPTRLPASLSIEDQRYVVVAFMRDLSEEVVEGDEDPEPAFMVLAAFESESECNRYVRNVAADEIQDHDLDVVTMRKWIHPEAGGLSAEVSTVYRHRELTEIMTQHKKDASTVAQFKKEQTKLGNPVEIHDIGAEGEDQPKLVFEAELFGEDEAAASQAAWDGPVEAAEPTAPAVLTAPVEPAVPWTKARLRRLRADDIRAMCRAHGLDETGSKVVTVDRLWAEIGNQ
jgi:hypothetical protein